MAICTHFRNVLFSGALCFPDRVRDRLIPTLREKIKTPCSHERFGANATGLSFHPGGGNTERSWGKNREVLHERKKMHFMMHIPEL